MGISFEIRDTFLRLGGDSHLKKNGKEINGRKKVGFVLFFCCFFFFFSKYVTPFYGENAFGGKLTCS